MQKAQSCREWGCEEMELSLALNVSGADGRLYEMPHGYHLKSQLVLPERIEKVPTIKEVLGVEAKLE